MAKQVWDIECKEDLLDFLRAAGLLPERSAPKERREQAEQAEQHGQEQLRDTEAAAAGAAVQIEYCAGGVSSKTALVIIAGKWYLVKQAREKLLVKVEWKADKERIAIEALGNEYYHRIVPAAVPAVVYYDPDNYILIREAVNNDYVMWKQDLLAGVLDFRIGEQCMLALAKVHNQTAQEPQAALDFANTKIFYQLRVSPYIEYLAAMHPELASEIALLQRKICSRRLALVHGDYSPKNTLVKGGQICLLDFEIAHYGDPIFDLSFIINHIVLKAVKNKQWAAAYLCLAQHMVETYFAHVAFDSREHCEAYAVKLLALFMLGRIDGKSPVEYLTLPQDQELVRQLASSIMRSTSYSSFALAFAEILGALERGK